MAKYKSCPSCGHRPGNGILDGNWFHVYKCKECGKVFCWKCGQNRGEKCPNCSSKKRQTIGEVYR